MIVVPDDDGGWPSIIWGGENTDPAFVARFVRGKWQYIGQLEIAYAISPYMSAPEALRERRVVHFIDNTSAQAALVKGYARAVDSGVLVNTFHAYNVGLKADAFFEYVRSKANIAVIHRVVLPKRVAF